MFDAILSQPGALVAVLFALSLLPLLLVLGSCFLKISIVFSLLRNAIGIQQIPPNMAIYGLALILSGFIMAPVGFQIQDNLAAHPITMDSPRFFEEISDQVLDPYIDFLSKQTATHHQKFFSEISLQVWPKAYQAKISERSLLVVIPAFTLSQLVEGFKIGLLLYLPFIAIDLIISNILLAMGMMMVSPITIALPFKLLVFILIGGWEKLMLQLVLSYS